MLAHVEVHSHAHWPHASPTELTAPLGATNQGALTEALHFASCLSVFMSVCRVARFRRAPLCRVPDATSKVPASVSPDPTVSPPRRPLLIIRPQRRQPRRRPPARQRPTHCASYSPLATTNTILTNPSPPSAPQTESSFPTCLVPLMEPTLFDAVTVASDSSLPQTPSPRNSLSLEHTFAENVKPPVDFDPLEPHSIFSDAYHQYPDRMENEPITHTIESSAMWAGNHGHGGHASPFFAPQRHGSTGSLLQELHGQDYMEHLDAYSPPPLSSGSEWSTPAQLPHPALPPHMQHEQQHIMGRRASYPPVRSNSGDELMHPGSLQQHYMSEEQHGHFSPYASRSDSLYSEPMSMGYDHGSPQPGLAAEPSALHGHMHFGTPPHLEESYLCNTSSPHHSMHEMDEGIKLEDSAPIVVPSQHVFYPRPPSQAGQLPPMPLYMTPHSAIPIQHTDDAASKETQYLRRRCHNCHTTEPPSWRRSTLNPGKIVCNKCGLYERTHLRPRPQRFDELRAGNKSRKHSNASKGLGGSSSPKEQAGQLVKKEQGEFEFETASSRRGSVSGSSVHSTCSDYDDSGKHSDLDDV